MRQSYELQRDAAAERRAAGEPVLPELRKPAARKGDGHLRVHLQRERVTVSASPGTREAGCRPGRVRHASRPPGRQPEGPFDSLWGGRGRAALRKGGKKRKGYRKGEENGPEHKSQKDKGQKQRHEHVTNYSPDKNKNYENRTYRQASHGKEHRLRTGRQ